MNASDQKTRETPYGIAPRGYRLPGATRLGRVRLQVADLERSLAFYRQVLGFRELHREGTAAALGTPGSDTPLVELHERRGASPVPKRGRLGLYHFAVLLPTRADLGRFLVHLSEQGVQAGAGDHDVSEALYLQDPDGLGIEVYADRPRSGWKTRGRELYIDTTAVDVADLARSGGDERWSGMPAGTVVGHVHLHVGSIEEAAAFYHQAVGFDQMTWSYPGALFLGAGGYHHHLGLNTWAGPDAPRAGEDDARLLEWEIVLPGAEEVEAAARSLEGAGYGVTRSGEGWTAPDPWGTVVRVRSAREEEADGPGAA